MQNCTTIGRPAWSTHSGHGSAAVAFFQGPLSSITRVHSGVIAPAVTFSGVVRRLTTVTRVAGAAAALLRVAVGGGGGGAADSTATGAARGERRA